MFFAFSLSFSNFTTAKGLPCRIVRALTPRVLDPQDKQAPEGQATDGSVKVRISAGELRLQKVTKSFVSVISLPCELVGVAKTI